MERGDLRYVMLDLLKERQSYGYELMQAIEERFHGFYLPSAGTVYPALQSLQDLECVSVTEQDGRKYYSITEEGRRFLAERREKVNEVWERMAVWWGAPSRGDERRVISREVLDLGRDMRHLLEGLCHDAWCVSPDKVGRIREVIAHASREIEVILGEPETDSTGTADAEARNA